MDSKLIYVKQECIPVGCIPPAHWPHLVVSWSMLNKNDSSRMHTTCSLTASRSICWGCVHAPWHPCPLPSMPPCHPCLPAMHAPCHACPLPCMPPAMHAYPCHVCPPLPCTPPAMRAPPPCTPPLPHTPFTPPSTHAPLPAMHDPTCEQNDRCLWKYYLAATSLRAVNILLTTDCLNTVFFKFENCSCWKVMFSVCVLSFCVSVCSIQNYCNKKFPYVHFNRDWLQ